MKKGKEKSAEMQLLYNLLEDTEKDNLQLQLSSLEGPWIKIDTVSLKAIYISWLIQLSTIKDQPKNRPTLFIFIEISNQGLQFFSVYRRKLILTSLERKNIFNCYYTFSFNRWMTAQRHCIYRAAQHLPPRRNSAKIQLGTKRFSRFSAKKKDNILSLLGNFKILFSMQMCLSQ